MAPVIGMDCNPIISLLESHQVTIDAVSEHCGLPQAVVYAALDPELAGDLATRDMLKVRAAVECLLPTRVRPELAGCWKEIDCHFSAGMNRSIPG